MDVHVPKTRNQEFSGAIQDLHIFNRDFPPDSSDGAVGQKNGNIFLNPTVQDVDDRHMANGNRFGGGKRQGNGGGKSEHGLRVAPKVSEGNGTEGKVMEHGMVHS